MNKARLVEFFSQDTEFVSNYNIFHSEVEPILDAVVDDHWNKIKDLEHYDLGYGYFAIDRKDIIPWIVGFYVLPEYRKNNNLLGEIIKKTNSLFCCCVSNSNLRAYNFLNKFCKIMNKDNTKTIFYYKRGL